MQHCYTAAVVACPVGESQDTEMEVEEDQAKTAFSLILDIDTDRLSSPWYEGYL